MTEFEIDAQRSADEFKNEVPSLVLLDNLMQMMVEGDKNAFHMLAQILTAAEDKPLTETSLSATEALTTMLADITETLDETKVEETLIKHGHPRRLNDAGHILSSTFLENVYRGQKELADILRVDAARIKIK